MNKTKQPRASQRQSRASLTSRVPIGPGMRARFAKVRPFLRRDLKSKVLSALVCVSVLIGMTWLGVSAFTRMDSQAAQDLRIELGIEQPFATCGGLDMPSCSYDDREQARVDEEFARSQRMRLAILQELDLRIAGTLAGLDEAETVLTTRTVEFQNGLPFGGDAELLALLAQPDLRPLIDEKAEFSDLGTTAQLLDAGQYAPFIDELPADTAQRLLAAISERRLFLQALQNTVKLQRERETDVSAPTSTVDRDALLVDMAASMEAAMDRTDRMGASAELYEWLEAGVSSETGRSAVLLSRRFPTEFASALRVEAAIWENGFDQFSTSPIYKPSVRYVSAVDDGQRRQLLGSVLFALAAICLLLVGPVVTATATAREREAGTLPVLRMTGMSAGDLAAAMILGPNVFALLAGGLLLGIGSIFLASTIGIGGLLMPLGLLAVLSTVTYFSAIGLGDALGSKVNAMVVGGLLGAALLIPGLLGTVLAGFDVAAVGLLLGPLPAVFSGVLGMTGFPGVGLTLEGGNTHLGSTILAYAVFSQTLLGFICLHSWRRRVERGHAALFRPLEGVLLALASIGCSALSLLDLSARANAQDFDSLNLLTFLSCSFLLPLLTWLLVSSLRRPARARVITGPREALRAFLRFQGFVLVTAALVGVAYNLVMNNSGLGTEESELMWATLAQALLVAETAVATLLWASRRRDGKLRAIFVGGAVVVLQLAMTLVVYGLEVQHVARHNAAAWPLLLNTEISPYWLAFLVLLWGAGIGIIMTALLRSRDRKKAEEEAQLDDEQDEEEYGMPGRRLIH